MSRLGVLAFRHVPFEGAGRIASSLETRGIALDYADLFAPGAPPPDIRRYAGLVFLGGPMSVNDPLTFLEWEMNAIRDAIGRAQPVLGICLGSQLIAKAMGARVYRNPQKEIGWFDLSLTSQAHEDPLFAGLPPVHTVFHWHGETFDLPPGAVRLASSERCRNQAFRLGHRTYGLQYHLEVTPEMIACWCAEDVNSGDVRELDAPIDPQHHREVLAALSEKVFTRWCDLLITAQTGVAAQ